ncbi:cuticular protein RR-1 motif 20 [Aphomia sociella]
MKLVINSILILSLVMTGMSDNEQFVFPPKFSKPNSGIFTSDSSLYLPPETHTTLPYFPMKNSINLPFPYLPPTRTKAPPVYPSPFPVMMSSTFMPNYEDDERENNERENKGSRPTKLPHQNNNKLNRTENHQEVQATVKRDMRINFQQPIDRVDVRLPMGFSTPNTINQKPTARSMIIDHRNDHGFDQLRAASSQAYIPQPGIFISSTTEPAIPILRLSNEMDLDGSFSYEALGADQTHYVQHSHMENTGTDKEEQVVEGSYSYVGDNGQTYTVHYIADSNGFRASGDHLPVAPPIPEIIQRSIQYNLAEEAKKPPHLKSWQQENQEYEINEIKESNHRFSNPTPPRNLFTGRTPEAFSNNYSQRSNPQNNLLTAASSQHTVQAVPDFSVDQNKGNSNGGSITPQVTFIASQGAHVPAANTGNHLSRLFSSEKSNMPQLINYDAAFKDVEQDSNKALWRWQYGLNSQNVNQTPEKNSISRSSGEGDDVMINFNDMSPEQYSKMIQSPEQTSSKEKSESQTQVNDIRPKIINSYNFTPPSQMVTQTYNYEETSYEPKKIIPFVTSTTKPEKQEPKTSNTINDEPNKQQQSKSNTKIPKFINSQNKPFNEIKNVKKKPFDLSEILNYITNKNNFESSKIDPKNNFPMFDTSNQRKELHLIPVQTNKEEEMDEFSEDQQNINRLRTAYHHHSHHEIPGNIKNYKLLLRNNKAIHNEENNDGIRRELAPPPIKRLHTHNLPPLGRAGPSIKTYLPPIFI